MIKNKRQLEVITSRDDPALVSLASEKIGAEWPEFMLHDPVADGLDACYKELPDFQFVLVDTASREPVAIANSIPLSWKGELAELPEDGWDWALTKGLDDLKQSRKVNILCALQVVIFTPYRGEGLSTHAIRAMKAIAEAHQLSGLIAPVRPSGKPDYPLTAIDQYVGWKNETGLPFDPWLRVHARLGARIIRPCHTAMRISGTVAQWESWTGLRFPESGDYIVPGTLVPVQIDCQQDLGVYIEPNVWMHHPPAAT